MERGNSPAEIKNIFRLDRNLTLGNRGPTRDTITLQMCQEDSDENECRPSGLSFSLPTHRYRARVAGSLGLEPLFQTIQSLELEELQVRNLRSLIPLSSGSLIRTAQVQLDAALVRFDALINRRNQLLTASSGYQNLRQIEGYFQRPDQSVSFSAPKDAVMIQYMTQPFQQNFSENVCLCVGGGGTRGVPGRIERGGTPIAWSRSDLSCSSREIMRRTPWYVQGPGRTESEKTFVHIRDRLCDRYVNLGFTTNPNSTQREIQLPFSAGTREVTNVLLALEPQGGVACRYGIRITDLRGNPIAVPSVSGEGVSLARMNLENAIRFGCEACTNRLRDVQTQLFRMNTTQFNSTCRLRQCSTIEDEDSIEIYPSLWLAAMSGARTPTVCEFWR